jgi:hypothetical protein
VASQRTKKKPAAPAGSIAEQVIADPYIADMIARASAWDATRDELRAARARVPDPRLWLAGLLLEGTQAALSAGENDLARVLLALSQAHEAGALPDLLARKGTILGNSNTFVERQTGSAVGARRPLLLKQIAEGFAPEPTEKTLPRILSTVENAFRVVGEPVLGPPHADWQARIAKECRKVQNRSNDADRLPIHYVRAVLRGWGLSEAKANDATKGIDF